MLTPRVADASGGGTSVGEEHWKYQGRLDVSPPGVEPLYDLGASSTCYATTSQSPS